MIMFASKMHQNPLSLTVVEGRLRDPVLDSRATVRAVNQTNRYLELLVELHAIVPARGREAQRALAGGTAHDVLAEADGCGRCHCPRVRQRVGGVVGPCRNNGIGIQMAVSDLCPEPVSANET